MGPEAPLLFAEVVVALDDAGAAETGGVGVTSFALEEVALLDKLAPRLAFGVVSIECFETGFLVTLIVDCAGEVVDLSIGVDRGTDVVKQDSMFSAHCLIAGCALLTLCA